jgi:hypothetical protein
MAAFENRLHFLPSLHSRSGISAGGRNRRRCPSPCEACLILTVEGEPPMPHGLLGVPNRSPYVKDGINNYVVHAQKDAVNAQMKGTKAAARDSGFDLPSQFLGRLDRHQYGSTETLPVCNS